jgi:malic enzyme
MRHCSTRCGCRAWARSNTSRHQRLHHVRAVQVFCDNFTEIAPIVYTPTVGWVCINCMSASAKTTMPTDRLEE